MIKDLFHNPPNKTQYLISVVAVLSVTEFGLALHNLIVYLVVALMLLVTVSLTLFLDIIPVIIAAVLSALLWNLFFWT
jgi:two-component system sensor histidine kinase KdpD